MRALAPALAALVACGLVLSSCGGDDDSKKASERASSERAGVPERNGEEDSEGRREVPGVPAADRIAYYQVATTTGTLRLLVSGPAVGRPRAIRRGEAARLRAAGARLRMLAPRDATLKRALTALQPGVARVVRAKVGTPLPRDVARKALATTDRTSRELKSFARRHPAIAGTLPD